MYTVHQSGTGEENEFAAAEKQSVEGRGNNASETKNLSVQFRWKTSKTPFRKRKGGFPSDGRIITNKRSEEPAGHLVK